MEHKDLRGGQGKEINITAKMILPYFTIFQSLKDSSMTPFPSCICKIVYPVKTMKIIDNSALLFLSSCAGKL